MTCICTSTWAITWNVTSTATWMTWGRTRAAGCLTTGAARPTPWRPTLASCCAASTRWAASILRCYPSLIITGTKCIERPGQCSCAGCTSSPSPATRDQGVHPPETVLGERECQPLLAGGLSGGRRHDLDRYQHHVRYQPGRGRRTGHHRPAQRYGQAYQVQATLLYGRQDRDAAAEGDGAREYWWISSSIWVHLD